MKPHNGSPSHRHSHAHRVPATTDARPNPTHEAIAERAFALWMASGCAQGQDVECWLEAERQLRDGCACAMSTEVELLPT